MDEEQLRLLYQELQRVLQEEAEQKRLLGAVSKKTEQDLQFLRTMITKSGKSLSDLNKEIEETAKTEKARQDRNKEYVNRLKGESKALASSIGSMTGSLARGEAKFEAIGGLFKGVASGIGGLMSTIPLFGKALDKLSQGIGGAGAFVISQLDTVGEVYRELGKVGATTAEGIDGLKQQFNDLGVVGLPAFAKAIRENGQGIAALGLTTSKGADMMAKSLGEIGDRKGPYLGPLLALGYGIEELTSIGARYGSMQILMGNRNIKTNKDLTTAMVNYLKEIDEVARATGKSREQVDDENKKMQADVAFRAKMEELRARGQGHIADEMEAFARRVGGARADAFRASVTGVPQTKEAQALMAFGQNYADIARRLEQGGKAVDEHRRLMENSSRGLKDSNKILQFNVAGQLGITEAMRETMDEEALRRRAQEQGKDPFKLAKEERQALEAKMKDEKSATNQYINAQIALADFGREAQRLAFQFQDVVIPIVEYFTETMADGAKAVRKGLGLEATAPGPAATANMGPAAARKRREAEQKAAEKAAKQGGGAGAPGGAAPGGAAGGGRAGPAISTQGLRLKSKEATAGGESDPRLIALAHEIQRQLGGDLTHFTGLNDTYKGRGANSAHFKGLGLDFTIKDPKNSAGTAELVRGILAKQGLKGKVIDEYVRGSKGKTGDHIHVEIEAMAKGGITRGLSIAGEAGPEAVVPLPDGRSIPVQMDMQSLVATIKAELGALPKDMGRELDAGMVSMLEHLKGLYTEIASEGRLGEAGMSQADYEKLMAESNEVIAKFKDAGDKGIFADMQSTVFPGILKQFESTLGDIPEEMKNARVGGLGMDASIKSDELNTDTKLTDMIMQRLGLSDMASKRAINLSGIGTNYNIAGAEFGSAMGGGVAREDITSRVADLVSQGAPLQEALQTTLTEFRSALTEFVNQQAGGGGGEGMLNLIAQLVDLQRQNNSTQARLLQVSQN